MCSPNTPHWSQMKQALSTLWRSLTQNKRLGAIDKRNKNKISMDEELAVKQFLG